MKKRIKKRPVTKFLFAGCCLLSVWLFSISTVFAGNSNAASDMGANEIVIPGGRMGNVTLPHQAHQKTLNNDCSKCHYQFPQKKGSILRLKSDGTLTQKAVMNACIDCHKKLKKAGRKSGPTSCMRCHKK